MHGLATKIQRLAIAALAATAVAAAVQTAPASADLGQPDESGGELPGYNCGGCSPATPLWENRDNDGDGLRNGDEVAGRAWLSGGKVTISFSPTRTDDPDTDSDGLSDGAEARDYAPSGNKLRSRTDPTVWDSDRDGHSDGLEVRYTRTRPDRWDTDGDGLSDGAEGMQHRTNARKSDTDGDCRTDGDEVRSGTDPSRYTTQPHDACKQIVRLMRVRNRQVLVRR